MTQKSFWGSSIIFNSKKGTEMKMFENHCFDQGGDYLSVCLFKKNSGVGVEQKGLFILPPETNWTIYA